MNKLIATAAAACLALSGAAHAASISISAFTIDEFDSVLSTGDFLVQDFEKITETPGELTGSLDTNVGKFSALDGTGNGSTCSASNNNTGDCTELSLFNTTENGQGNLVPEGGIWSLNANDTFGILWEVAKLEGESIFNRVVFGLMDAADIGNTEVTIDVKVTNENGDTETLSGLNNAEQKLIVIDFAQLQTGATVEIRSSKLNDSFSIDGASVGVVPLPAGGLLLLTGFGALALRRRKQAAKAA